MATESVSFRITRTAEDLANTVSALSHRLVRLEQRLTGLELQLTSHVQPGADELASLENVERLLSDCRSLLEESAPADPSLEASPAYEGLDHAYAA
jgi:DNA-binding transcriptional LysR family regulator